MTRLFLRFYFGVICILVMAWFIQGLVVQLGSSQENVQVVEQALSGGVRMAIDRMDAARPEDLGRVLTSVQSQFEYPVQLVVLAEHGLSDPLQQRMLAGEVVFYRRSGSFVAGALRDGTRALEFGRLPSFVGPSQWEVTLGFGVVLLLAALAIATLLRPLAGQLRAVERTALAIADGDLSARVDTRQIAKGLPLANAFNTMADRTQALLNSQRELLQAVSHELRTPLARIRFAIDLMEGAASAEERAQRLAAVDRATEELDELVGELLTYVRMESPDPARQWTDFDIHELVEDVVEARRSLFPDVVFAHHFPDENEPMRLIGDRASLGRAIGNLLGNAGKFARRHVNIRVTLERQECILDVDDDGPGIPPAERTRIFEPFVRLPDSTGNGAGLGLAIVKRIVDQHGGSVSVADSTLGGAKFQLRLPCENASASASINKPLVATPQ